MRPTECLFLMAGLLLMDCVNNKCTVTLRFPLCTRYAASFSLNALDLERKCKNVFRKTFLKTLF